METYKLMSQIYTKSQNSSERLLRRKALEIGNDELSRALHEENAVSSIEQDDVKSLPNELVSVKDHNTQIRHDLETTFDGLLDELDSTKEHDAKIRCDLETKLDGLLNELDSTKEHHEQIRCDLRNEVRWSS